MHHAAERLGATATAGHAAGPGRVALLLLGAGRVTDRQAPDAAQVLRAALDDLVGLVRSSRCRRRGGPRTGGAGAARRHRPSAKYSSGETTLPFDFDIARPSRRIMPWQNSCAKGSRTSFGARPMSPEGAGEEAGVEEVQDRVRDPADVLVDGHEVPRRLHVDRLDRRPRGCRSAGSTTTSRRRCPSCRSRASPGRHSAGRSSSGTPGRSGAATRRSAGTRRRSGSRTGSSSSGTGTMPSLGQ